MGEGLSAAGLRYPRPCLLSPTGTQSRAIQGAGVSSADSANPGSLFPKYQFDCRAVPAGIAQRECRRFAPGKSRLRYRPTVNPGRVQADRRNICEVAQSIVGKKICECDADGACEYPGVLC